MILPPATLPAQANRSWLDQPPRMMKPGALIAPASSRRLSDQADEVGWKPALQWRRELVSR